MNGEATHDPTAEPVLEMIDVAVTSLKDSSTTILEGVNWRVRRGDYWAVAGLLRSGKSDLMAVAAGLLRPARGFCRWFGREHSGFERVGLVFDGGQLLHHLTLAENIALPLNYHETVTASDVGHRVKTWLAFTDLEPWARKYPAEVSHNLRQRIGLARALALEPELLLLDSPLTGLDPRDAGWWLDKLAALHCGDALAGAGPLTIVATGDDLGPWHQRANQFALLQAAQFLPLGGRAELAARPELRLRELLPASAEKS
jgi:ABC-type transporter Mla maintaining outer membrane lipid asymmetry ATPase subunit MlaF